VSGRRLERPLKVGFGRNPTSAGRSPATTARLRFADIQSLATNIGNPPQPCDVSTGCGIIIPHRCLPNADNISGRFARGQRLEVARQRRHSGGCDVGRRHLRAGRRCAPARSSRRAPQVSERRLVVALPLPELRKARAQAEAARKGHVLAMLRSKRAWISHIGRLGGRARRGAGQAD
jgi:hypothetical protein